MEYYLSCLVSGSTILSNGWEVLRKTVGIASALIHPTYKSDALLPQLICMAIDSMLLNMGVLYKVWRKYLVLGRGMFIGQFSRNFLCSSPSSVAVVKLSRLWRDKEVIKLIWWATNWNTDKERRDIQQARSYRYRLWGSKVVGSGTGLCLVVEFGISSVLKLQVQLPENCLVGWCC